MADRGTRQDTSRSAVAEHGPARALNRLGCAVEGAGLFDLLDNLPKPSVRLHISHPSEVGLRDRAGNQRTRTSTHTSAHMDRGQCPPALSSLAPGPTETTSAPSKSNGALNDCTHDCASGSIHHTIYRWTGTSYTAGWPSTMKDELY